MLIFPLEARIQGLPARSNLHPLRSEEREGAQDGPHMAGARSSEHALRSAPVRATARGAHRPNPFCSGHKRADIPPNWVLCHLHRRVRYSALGLRGKQVILTRRMPNKVWCGPTSPHVQEPAVVIHVLAGRASRAGSWSKGGSDPNK